MKLLTVVTDHDESVALPSIGVVVRKLAPSERSGNKIEQMLASTRMTLVRWVLESAANRLLIEQAFDAVHREPRRARKARR